MLGMVLADSTSTALANSTAALRAYNWSACSVNPGLTQCRCRMFPAVLGVEGVAQAKELASTGISPLPAVSLPTLVANSSAALWGSRLLELLASLANATADRALKATMAVTVSACAYESESLYRAAAYWSVIWGSQALWWDQLSQVLSYLLLPN